MSAAREMYGVEEMGGGVREGPGGGAGSVVCDGAGKGIAPVPKSPPGISVRPWLQLVREVAPVYQAGIGHEPAAADSRAVNTDVEPLDPEDETPDPNDELFTLGERCAEAYMQADALQYQAMRLLVEFHHREGWRDTGFTSTAEWLAWRIGIQPGAARERLRTALALEELPQISEAMERGSLSFTKVRALTRVATPENEITLLEFAQAGSAANLERLVRGWKALDRKSELTAEQLRHRTRRFSAFVDLDGMVVVRGRLDPEVGAMLMRAVEAASDALFREARSEKDESNRDPMPIIDEPNTELQEVTPEQRRADAVGLIAERALAAGFGSESGGRDADAPISGSKAERYQVMLHVDENTLREHAEPGQSELEDGTRVSAETSRRLSCDCGVVKIGHGPGGEVVGAGRKTRTVPPALRRALEARDRGCRFPGCGLRFTEAHHIQHWADGGETSQRNMALLCSRHHRAVHEGQVRICIDVRGQVAFFTPKGKTLFDAPPARGIWAKGRVPGATRTAETTGGAEATGSREATRSRETTRSEGSPPQPTPQHPLRPAHLSGASKWQRDRDIPYAVEARAWEALDSG